jgi:hypothetical protein
MGIHDEVFIFENFLDNETCKRCLNTCIKYFKQFENDDDYLYNWDKKHIKITEFEKEIVLKVKTFLENKFSTTLRLQNFEAQIWPNSFETSLHKHIDKGREHTDFNSIIYLNEDFDGGEFYTDDGLSYKPKTGTLTFFNGQTVAHGVKKVLGNNRYTLIFWWLKPSFPSQDQVHGTEES